jgi:peptidoglycan/LPS O-acetylase OafA/YrhL
MMNKIAQPMSRLYFIDWIRVLAFGLLILFHCTMPFVTFGWEIKNEEQSVFLSRIIIWLHQWRLPLLFFIAGVGAHFSLANRKPLAFLGERFVRLFIPLAFAMMFTIPFQVYFEWLQTGRITSSYAEFYPSVWEFVPYPDGSFTWSHLWFVVYLFVFTLLLWPLFSIMQINLIKRGIQKLESILTSPITIIALSGIFMLYYFQLYIQWPEQQNLIADWFNFIFSITLFFLGFLLSHFSSFWQTCEKYRWHFFIASMVCMIVLFAQYYWPLTLPKKQDQALYLYGVLDSIHIWMMIVSLLGFARKKLNFSNAFLRYTTPAVYPFYILHQTIIVAAGYYVTQWSLPIMAKLLILIVVCFGGVYVLYEFLIKRFAITRLLYGIKITHQRNS